MAKIQKLDFLQNLLIFYKTIEYVKSCLELMGIDLGHFVKQKHVAWNSKIMAYNKNYSKNRPNLHFRFFVYGHKMGYIFQNTTPGDLHLALQYP